MKAKGVGCAQHAFPGNSQGGAQTVIIVVLEGNEGVEPVVASRELDQDENRAVLLGRGRGGAARIDEERRREPAEGEQGGPARGLPQEFTAGRGKGGRGEIGGHGRAFSRVGIPARRESPSPRAWSAGPA